MQTLATDPTVRKPLSRSVKQISALRQRGRNAPERFGGAGVRPDRIWAADPLKLGDEPRSNIDLANAIEWMHARRGAKMTATDRATLDEMHNRSWGFRECSAARMRALPAWASDRLPLRRSGGYRDFLGLVLSAYRSGAIGVHMSYAESMAVCQVSSESTWRRWTSEMEDLGLVRITQTWVPDESGARARVYGALLYRIGPTLEEWGGEAVLERALDERSEAAKRARIAGAQARKAQRGRDWARLRHLAQRRDICNHDAYRRSTGGPAAGADASFQADLPVNETVAGGCAYSDHDKNVTCRTNTYQERPAEISKKTRSTPLGRCDNRNALPPPSSGGKHHTPPGGGMVEKKAQPTPQAAPVADKHASAAPLAADVDTATALAELLLRVGTPRREVERLRRVYEAPAGRSPSAEPNPPVGRSPDSSASSAQKLQLDRPHFSSDLTQTGHPSSERCSENSGQPGQTVVKAMIGDVDVPLHGPLANELASLFFSAVTPRRKYPF